jgi:membrane protease subunit (stomatin/prohibitin family)
MAIVEVIKYNGTPDIFAWKYPSEELGTWTQLIVNESQEAVLVKGGKACDVFPSGRHTLETANIPILNGIIKAPFGGRTPFTAEVWYINKVYALDIKWGTPLPIQIQDPKYSVFVPVRAFGQFGITIEDARMFLTKLVGTLPVFDNAGIIRYFRGLYLTKVKDAISSYLVHKQISIMEINAYLEELSEHLREKIAPVLAEYGIRLVNFYINDISVPEDDSAVKQLKDALAKRAEMNIIGYSYQQQRSFDTLEGAAKNTGTAAGLMGAGLGLGMGAAVGGAVGGEFAGVARELNTQAGTKNCPNCNAPMEKSKRFCADCGFDTLKSGAQPEHENVSCAKCGAAFKNTMKFCPECGKKYIPCPKCGADLDEGAEVCAKCGYEFPLPCPKCGAPLPSRSARFCPECGESLVMACPGCGAPVSGSPKFCAECGYKFELK